MSGVPIVAVKIEYYCFNHSERAPKRIQADRESSKNSTGASKQTLKVAAETTESELVEAIQTEIRTYQLEEAECKRVAEHKQEEIELLSTRISQIAESLEDAKAKESAAIQMLHKAKADFSEHKAKLEKYQGMIVEINNPDFGTNMAGKPTSEALKLFNEELRVQAKTDTKTKVTKMLKDEVSKGDGLEAEIAKAEVTSKSGIRTRFANELAEALTQKGQLEADVTEKMKFADIAEKQVAKHEAVLKRYQPSTFYVEDLVPHSLDDEDGISQTSMDSYSYTLPTMRRHSEKLSLSEDILTRFPDLRHVETRS